ncbi:ferredoxin reductase family protein [Pseudonocardia sp.]|uniref:ferredoxin reductase family protein n=1 Tax=Pseudonocardia sp. TaxID=60912 RepID=UPI003D0AB4C4
MTERVAAAAAPARAPWQSRQARVVAWQLGYLVLALAPLPLCLIDLDPGRGFWVNLSVAAGFMALSLLGLQFLLAARWPRATTPFGADVLLQFHRQVTVLIVVLALGHPTVLFVWDSRFLGLLDVVSAPVRAKLAVLSVVALLVLVATSVWRSTLRLSYPAWQALHAGLALVVAGAGLAHVIMIGYYVDQRWEQALWIAYTAAFVWVGVYVRVVKPIGRYRRRFRVVAVTKEAGGSHGLELEPATPAAVRAFAPGQFAWIMVGRSPFALTYHPFSYASSAEHPERVRFVIRGIGPFTAGIGEAAPGAEVYVDGPWGHFSPDRVDATGWVLIAGGVGITPMLSILLTRRDRGDQRPAWLFYAVRDEQSLVAGDVLAELAADPGVTIVPVLSRPSDGWGGERGRIDADHLRRNLPADVAGLHAFVCGPPGMTDAGCAAAEAAGIDPRAVHSEKFSMV